MTLEKLTREEMLHELRQFEKVAREHGWSEEEFNCTPWAFLDDELRKLEFLRQVLDSKEAHPPTPPPEPPPPDPDQPSRPAAHLLTRGLSKDIPPKRRG